MVRSDKGSSGVIFTLDTADLANGTLTNPWNTEVKDKSGDCNAINTITVVREDGQPIEGAASLIINVAYGGVAIYTDGTDWYTQGGSV